MKADVAVLGKWTHINKRQQSLICRVDVVMVMISEDEGGKYSSSLRSSDS